MYTYEYVLQIYNAHLTLISILCRSDRIEFRRNQRLAKSGFHEDPAWEAVSTSTALDTDIASKSQPQPKPEEIKKSTEKENDSVAGPSSRGMGRGRGHGRGGDSITSDMKVRLIRSIISSMKFCSAGPLGYTETGSRPSSWACTEFNVGLGSRQRRQLCFEASHRLRG